MKKLSRKFCIEAATCTAAKGRDRKKVSKRWGKRAYEEYMECFCYRADCSTNCSFLPGAVPSKYFFCSLQWVEKVTAQMIPSSSPLVKFWHGSLFVTSPHTQCACTITHLTGPCSLWPFSFSLKSIDAKMAWFIFFSSPGLLEHDFMKKRPERKYEVHEFPVWNVHEAHGRSTAVGRNDPSRTQTIILQVIYSGRHILESRCAERCATDAFLTSFRATLKGLLSLTTVFYSLRGRSHWSKIARFCIRWCPFL